MDKNNIKKEYTNGEVTVLWQSAKCIHSGVCVKNLHQVFNPQVSAWINLSAGSTAGIIETVKKCPSGALSIKEA